MAAASGVQPRIRLRAWAVNSSTWYATAMFGLALTCPPEVCGVAVMVLGIGDPAAAAIGRRFGRTRFSCGRSLEGSLAFVVAGSAAALLTLSLFHPDIAPLNAVLLALGGGLAGAGAELGARSIDDNFMIPLAAAAGASLSVIAL